MLISRVLFGYVIFLVFGGSFCFYILEERGMEGKGMRKGICFMGRGIEIGKGRSFLFKKKKVVRGWSGGVCILLSCVF